MAIGIIMMGLAALLRPLSERLPPSKTVDRLAISFTAGSLWLIVAGSALYVGGAYASTPAYLFAVRVVGFSASMFIAYSSGVAGKVGYATVSYLWFLLVYYAFFVTPADGLPLGLALVVTLDFVLSRGRLCGVSSRVVVLPSVAVLYGVIYYPILPASLTLGLNAGLLASALGVSVEYLLERAVSRKMISVG